ncbi:MAG: RNA 2',3'-cyclic phosphodiesterase [Planctomycetota bacterium]
MARLFTAIELPSPLKDDLLKLSCSIPGAHWSKREQMHLTITFIGEVESNKQSQIQEALSTITSEPFSLKVEHVGTFPNPKYPKILWVGISLFSGLSQLKTQIEQALQKAIAFTPEVREYNPHLTLARLRGVESKELTQFLEKQEHLSYEAFPVEHFNLYSSKLLRTGAEYRVEQSYPLS